MNFVRGKAVEEFEINGESVIFRYPKIEDVRDCMKVINSIVDEDHYILKLNKVSLKEERKWLEKQIEKMENDQMIRLHVEVEGKVMGGADVNRKQKEGQSHIAEVGISLRKEIRDEGIEKKKKKKICEIAKNELGIEIARISYIDGNERAKYLYEKLGFKEIGVFPKSRKINDSYDDEILMYKEL